MFWDPFDEFERMHRDIDMLFGPRRGKALVERGDNFGLRQQIRPARANICETESEVIASFELPGASKKDIELNVADDYIEVRVEKKHEQEKEDKKKGTYMYRSSSSQFYRRLPFPAEVEADKAKASYEDGVLRVNVPKVEAKKDHKRKIEIE